MRKSILSAFDGYVITLKAFQYSKNSKIHNDTKSIV